MVRVAIDAMGGDHAPKVVLDGVVLALERDPSLEIHLVGPAERLRKELRAAGSDPDRFRFEDASQVVEMHESPVDSLRKKPDSSIRKMIELVKEKRCDAAFSAGNTGAVVASAQMHLGLLPGARRAAIGVMLPVGKIPTVLIDAGANVQCKPLHLVQFGIMAADFARKVLNIPEPKIGLLSVGEEEQKGTRLTKETNDLMKSAGVPYHGNVEGRDIFRSIVSVVVCDGFVGNIVLKTSEGLWEKLSEMLAAQIKEHGESTGREHLGKVLSGLRSRLDYNEYGGAPLLGVNGTVLIGHGRSDAKAVASAARTARDMYASHLNDAIVASLDKIKALQGATAE